MNFPPLKTLYLKAYRFVGFLILSASMAFLFGYGFIMLFFMFNTTWLAPTILSATSDKMLQFNSGYLSALQTNTQLDVILQQQQLALTTTRKQYDDLVAFQRSIQGGAMLKAKKRLDLAKSAELNNKLAQTRKQTEQSLSVGLINGVDATREIAAIQQFNNATTDSEIELATLQQQLINLDAQINQLGDLMVVEQETIKQTQANLEVAKHTLSSLNDTAYAHSRASGSNLAFLAYDNFNSVHEGQPVYDCYLLIVACHKVGTINHIYKDEQVVDFPLFNVRLSRTVRGVFADIDVTDSAAMKSSVWFANKPLWF